MTTKTIGQNIRRARKRAGISQTDLGLRCGWENSPQSRVGHYESGAREPSFDDLRRIAKALSCTMAELFDGADNSLAGNIAKKLDGIDPKYHSRILDQLDATIAMLKDK